MQELYRSRALGLAGAVVGIFVGSNLLFGTSFAKDKGAKDSSQQLFEIENPFNCKSSREYITTLEYLRDKKNFVLPEQEARRIAEKVSSGCTGAAQRFIKVSSTLTRGGLLARDSIQTGVEFSGRTDAETDTFVSVFLSSFTSQGLDLDLGSSLKMARSLTTEFHGNILAVRQDFEQLVQFCIAQSGLDLPRPECGHMAARLVKETEKFEGKMAGPFILLFQFLNHSTGPNLTPRDAFLLSEQIIQNGKLAPDNFIEGYKYASSSRGLNLSNHESIEFGKKMAQMSYTDSSQKDPSQKDPSQKDQKDQVQATPGASPR